MKLYCYLQGGLGNQMFQYAKGLSVLRANGFEELLLDTTSYKNQERKVVQGGVTGRGYDLDVFGISYNKTQKWEHSYPILRGYFQNIKEFENVKDEIKKEFTFKNKFSDTIEALANEIKNNDSVSIHVRRGDYVSNLNAFAWHGVMDKEYFENAMSIIESEISSPTYYVFSEDIEWCIENIKGDDIVYVGNEYAGEKDTGHLYLMTQCKYHIMSNSSYSWWGSFLGESELTIGPKKWLANCTGSDIMLDEWIKI